MQGRSEPGTEVFPILDRAELSLKKQVHSLGMLDLLNNQDCFLPALAGKPAVAVSNFGACPGNM